jgi:hydroxymethylbilane synthase
VTASTPAPYPSTAAPRHSRALPLHVGTRGSRLAVTQTRMFIDRIATFCPVLRDQNAFVEHIIRTTGDIVQDRPLAEIGGKGLFAKEIHEALADQRVDFAVHSLKDLETTLPSGIVLACTMTREDARDALLLAPGLVVSDPANPLAAIPRGAVVGTSSVRRQAMLSALRPDLVIVPLRGNIDSRLAKLEPVNLKEGSMAAIVLAQAGLVRIGLGNRADALLDPEVFVPAGCQGIVGITCRGADHDLVALLGAIEDPVSAAVARAERALLAALDGSCRTPVGGHARIIDGTLHLTGLVMRVDGSFALKRALHGAPAEAALLGDELGRSLRRDSPDDIFAA